MARLTNARSHVRSVGARSGEGTWKRVHGTYVWEKERSSGRRIDSMIAAVREEARLCRGSRENITLPYVLPSEDA